MATQTKVQIGSISHGTLRTEDLLEAFQSELFNIDGPSDATLESLALLNILDNRDWTDEEQEQASMLVDDLQDALNEFAPPYCYFGAHPGDGSDFGFWPDVDRIEEAMLDAVDLPTLGDEYKLLPDEGVIVHVNDHGNMALYEIDLGHNFWSVV